MIHLIITNDSPQYRFKQLGLASSLYNVRVSGRTLTAEAVDKTHKFIVINPSDSEDLIRCTQGIPLATFISDVPLKPGIYSYLISRVRRSDLCLN